MCLFFVVGGVWIFCFQTACLYYRALRRLVQAALAFFTFRLT